MTKFKMGSLLLIGMMGLTSCIRNPADINNDINNRLKEDNKKTEEENKKTEDDLTQLTSWLIQGGQPGLITVSGIIVDADTKMDDRISVKSISGKGKDGTTPAVLSSFKPVFITKIQKLDLAQQSKDGTLLALGCEEKVTAQMAKERNLQIQEFKKSENTVMAVSAKVIMLCGDAKDIQGYQFIQVDADELVLMNVNLIHLGMLGGLTFNMNKLMLIGANKIESNGYDLSFTASMTPTIDLKVAQEISSADNGTLLLSSTGSNYKEDEKK